MQEPLRDSDVDFHDFIHKSPSYLRALIYNCYRIDSPIWHKYDGFSIGDVLQKIEETDSSLIDQFDVNGMTALQYASFLGNLEAVSALITKTADLNIVDAETSPLHLAVRSGNFKLVELLVDNGADWKAYGDGTWGLKIACEYGNLDIVEYFTKKR